MKLSRIDKKKIREALVDGLTQEELSLIFGVSQSTISNIAKHSSNKENQMEDIKERFVGGATIDDGCYHSVLENKIPSAYIDYNDPLSILIAEENLMEKDDE